MNGTLVAKNVIEGIENGNKIYAIKNFRELDTTITTYSDGKVTLLDSKLFVEELMWYINKLKSDCASRIAQANGYEAEFARYAKLRNAGFSMAEATRIMEIIKV